MVLYRFAVLLFVLAAAVCPLIAHGTNTEIERVEGFQWGPALRQAGFFLGIQHGFRLATEAGTREELRGPFWRDYVKSVKKVRGWGDSDPFIVNYIGHPFGGAVVGFIQVHNDPRFRTAAFSASRRYWTSRARAMAFAAVYSAQFEVGPVSEASIGNIGKADGTAGAVDLVMTPVGGLGMMVVEDALDRFVVRRIENHTASRIFRAAARGFLNPNRSFANMMRLKFPWHRDQREGVSEEAGANRY